MSKYNEQHATTMLNALIGTETLKRYEEKIRADERTKVFDELSVYLLNSCKDVKCKEDITANNDFDFYASELLEALEQM